MEKMTKRDYFNAIKAIPAVAENVEFVAFIDHELELLAKKNASRANGEMTETQKENAEIAAKIVDYMNGAEGAKTISDIRKHFGLSSQKVTPIMTKLVNDGVVNKNIEKRVAYFTVA